MRKGRRFLAGICALALTFSFTPVGGYLPGDAGVEEAKAETDEYERYGDWCYVKLEDGTVGIVGYEGEKTEIKIPSVINGKTVTVIGQEHYWLFNYCDSLISVSIPNSIKTIDVMAFYGCDNLTEIVIPKNVETIEFGVLAECDSLTEITIPENVTFIGKRAFSNCDSLIKFNIENNNQYYSVKDGNLYNKAQTELIQYANGKTDTLFVIPGSVTTVGDSAFWGCASLKSIAIPKGVTTIGDMAFANCVNLTSITIPGSVTTIGGGAFFSCSSLKSVTIPEGVTTIKENAFCDCDSLKSVTIPESVKTIEYGTFWGCTSLTSIMIPKSVTIIGDDAFGGCKNLEIKGYRDSYAQTYAKQHNIKFIALDDRESYKVIFNSAGGSAVAAQTVTEGETAVKPADPTKKGYIFAGWYNGSTKYDFSKAVTGNLTLTAKWTYQCSTPSISKAENTNGGVKLTWNKVTGAAKYRVFYKKNGKWAKIADTTGTSYTWKGAKGGTKYTFTVRCVNSDGKTFTSGYNASGKSIRYLAQPEIKKFEANNSGLKITWGKVTGASKYRVYYKTAKGWKQLRETSGTSCTINATLGKNYTYTVRAFNGSDSSTYNKTGKAFKRLATPKLSSAVNVKGGVKITWGKVSSAAKYRVYYKTGSGSWKKLADTTSTNYTWKKAKKGTTYTFTVRCINSSASAYTSGYNTTGKKVKYNGK